MYRGRAENSELQFKGRILSLPPPASSPSPPHTCGGEGRGEEVSRCFMGRSSFHAWWWHQDAPQFKRRSEKTDNLTEALPGAGGIGPWVAKAAGAQSGSAPPSLKLQRKGDYGGQAGLAFALWQAG